MQDKDATMVVPTLRPQDKHMQIRPWSDPENRPTRSPLRDQVNGYDRILGSSSQCVTGRGVHSQRRADVAAADLPAHDRGVRAAYRPRRLSPRAYRRRDRRMTSRLPGGKVDVLAGRDRGQRREPAQVGAADVKPAELNALDQGVPSLRPQRQHTKAVLQGDDVDLVVPPRLGAE